MTKLRHDPRHHLRLAAACVFGFAITLIAAVGCHEEEATDTGAAGWPACPSSQMRPICYTAAMATKEPHMPKVHVRGDTLTVTLPSRIRQKIGMRDGDQVEVTAEGGRIVLTPAAEEPLPGELEAIREGEEEFARGGTRRLDDVQHELGLPTK